MKKFLTCFTLICIIILSSSFAYSQKISKDLSDNIFRLHVIANSDSDFDQKTKLKVRDYILECFNSQKYIIQNIDDAITTYSSQSEYISNIVTAYLYEKGIPYSANVIVTKSYFPTKQYDEFTLPSGTYNCLKVSLGDAKGKNWWCILYPNLCITEFSSNAKNSLEHSLTKEAYNVISSNISYKFRIVEIFENLKAKH